MRWKVTTKIARTAASPDPLSQPLEELEIEVRGYRARWRYPFLMVVPVEVRLNLHCTAQRRPMQQRLVGFRSTGLRWHFSARR